MEAGRVYATKVVRAIDTQISRPYAATTDRVWRILHDARTDQIVWQTAPAAAGPWTELWRQPRELPVTAVRVWLWAGTYTPVADPGKAAFDDFRLERL